MDKIICALGIDEDFDYESHPAKFLGYLVNVTIYLGEDHYVTFGPMTPDQVRQIAKDLVEDLDNHLQVFARMEELREQAEKGE